MIYYVYMFTFICGVAVGALITWGIQEWKKINQADAAQVEETKEVAVATPVTPKKAGRPKKSS